MRVFIDESKKIDKGEIVLGGFLTYHSTKYIEKFFYEKKEDFNIPKNAELKSTKKYGKYFLEQIEYDEDLKKLDFWCFGKKYDNYFLESEEAYSNLLLDFLIEIFSNIQCKKGEKVYIFHDNFNAKNNAKTEKKLEKIISEKFLVKANMSIHNSKKLIALQIADIITGEYRKKLMYAENNFSEILTKKHIHNKKT